MVRSTATEPNRASPKSVPKTVPKKPAVPSMATSSAMRRVGTREVTKVIEVPYTPAMAQQYEMRSR